MATGLFALLDDMATILDDVAILTKVAAKKTAGVLGDDLALNAQQVAGVRAERELPVVWAVAKGSLINKAILVPAALLISAVAPALITPLMMIGGAFLCFEGVEKLAHKFLHKDQAQAEHAKLTQALVDERVDLKALEADKIKGAIRTDFILSAEIIVISLGTVASAALGTQLAVLVGMALLMTVGVYGLVAGIVKLDDLGLWLTKQVSGTAKTLGRGILSFAPWLMKALSVVGTAAMFLVGGGILVHSWKAAHHWQEGFASWLQTLMGSNSWLDPIGKAAFDGTVGVLVGALVLALVMGGKKPVAKALKPLA